MMTRHFAVQTESILSDSHFKLIKFKFKHDYNFTGSLQNLQSMLGEIVRYSQIPKPGGCLPF